MSVTIINSFLCLMQMVKAPVESLQFSPNIRSGSFADIGPRRYMEDEHIRIDDLSGHLGSLLMCPAPNAFYGVCKKLIRASTDFYHILYCELVDYAVVFLGL